MSDGGPKDPRRPKLDLQIDREVGRGVYANATVVTNGPTEIVLDFVAALPHGKAQVVSRVVLPARQAKALARSLARNVERWEARHGALPDAAPTRPPRPEDEEPN